MFYKNLKENERIIGIIRHYGLTYFWSGLICSILIISPFFFILPLFQRKPWGVVLFCLILFLGIFWGLNLFINWYYNCFFITNQRIIVVRQKSIFERTVSEISYEEIRSVSYQFKGIFQTLFHYGTIRIQTIEALELARIYRPEKIHNLIITLKAEFQEAEKRKSLELSAEEVLNRLSTQELVKVIQGARKKLGEEVFERILEKGY